MRKYSAQECIKITTCDNRKQNEKFHKWIDTGTKQGIMKLIEDDYKNIKESNLYDLNLNITSIVHEDTGGCTDARTINFYCGDKIVYKIFLHTCCCYVRFNDEIIE
jgi:hypothetical protein